MYFTLKKKQNILFFGLIIITAVASIITYHGTQQKWILFRTAENSFDQKSYQQAIHLYQKSLEKGVTTPVTYLHLADSQVAMGNFEGAIKNYRVYLNHFPHDQDVRLLLARALSWNGNIEESAKEYEKLLKHSDPEELNNKIENR